ncbi:MAG: hypothetical protein QW559_03705 [Candidatus Woesearchaeota archaeon]
MQRSSSDDGTSQEGEAQNVCIEKSNILILQQKATDLEKLLAEGLSEEDIRLIEQTSKNPEASLQRLLYILQDDEELAERLKREGVEALEWFFKPEEVSTSKDMKIGLHHANKVLISRAAELLSQHKKRLAKRLQEEGEKAEKALQTILEGIGKTTIAMVQLVGTYSPKEVYNLLANLSIEGGVMLENQRGPEELRIPLEILKKVKDEAYNFSWLKFAQLVGKPGAAVMVDGKLVPLTQELINDIIKKINCSKEAYATKIVQGLDQKAAKLRKIEVEFGTNEYAYFAHYNALRKLFGEENEYDPFFRRMVEIFTLRRENQGLRSAIENKERAMVSLNKIIDEENKKYGELKEKYFAKIEELKDAKNSLKFAKEHRSRLFELLRNYLERIKGKESAIKKQTEITDCIWKYTHMLEKSLERAVKKAAEDNNLIKNNQLELEKLKAKNANCEGQIKFYEELLKNSKAEYEKQIRILSFANTTLRAKAKELYAAHEKLSSEHEEMTHELKRTKEMLSEAKQSIDQLVKKNSKLENKLNSYTRKHSYTNEEVEKLKEQKGKLENELEDWKKKYESHEKELSRVVKELGEVGKEFLEYKKGHMHTNDEFKAKEEELNKKNLLIKSLQDERDEQKKRVEELEKEREANNTLMKGLQETIKSFGEQLNEHVKELKSLQKSHEEYVGKHSYSNEEYNRIQEELKREKSNYAKLKEENEKLENEKKALTDNLNKISEAIQKINAGQPYATGDVTGDIKKIYQKTEEISSAVKAIAENQNKSTSQQTPLNLKSLAEEIAKHLKTNGQVDCSHGLEGKIKSTHVQNGYDFSEKFLSLAEELKLDTKFVPLEGEPYQLKKEGVMKILGWKFKEAYQYLVSALARAFEEKPGCGVSVDETLVGEILYNLGCVFERTGNNQRALRHFEKSYAYEPTPRVLKSIRWHKEDIHIWSEPVS